MGVDLLGYQQCLSEGLRELQDDADVTLLSLTEWLGIVGPDVLVVMAKIHFSTPQTPPERLNTRVWEGGAIGEELRLN